MALVALFPAASVFAGGGDGEGKKSILTIQNTGSASTINLHINQVVSIGQINIRNSGAYIKEINPATPGVDIVIGIADESFYSSPENDGGIIIEIVGVDNITGIGAEDGNTGTTIQTGFHSMDDENEIVGGPETGYNNAQAELPSNQIVSTKPIIPTFTPSTGKNDINIFPNPVMNETNVVTVGEILGREIKVMDLSGHIIIAMTVNNASRQTVLNLEELNPGIYIIIFETEDGKTISKKIQKI